MKQSLKKQPSQKQVTTLTTVRSLTSLEFIPAASVKNSSQSLGNPVVELATSKGTINLTEGTNKNAIKVCEGSPSW
jgi:hypothetical protein